MAPTPTLAALIGGRVRELRTGGGLTLEELANAMRERGFRWSTARVVEVESGKVALNLPMLVMLGSALRDLLETEISLATLLPKGHILIEIAPGVEVYANNFREVLAGATAPLIAQSYAALIEERVNAAAEDASSAWLRGPTWSAGRVGIVAWNASLADERAAKSLGVTMPALATIAQALWDRPLSWERDIRLPEYANAQAAGRITRELLEECRAYIEGRKQESGHA